MSVQSADELIDRTGTSVRGLGDRKGRFSVSYYFHDVTTSAYVNPTRGQETTLVTGPTTAWLDLIQITASNTSSVATGNYVVDVRCSTAGGIQDTFVIPNNSTVTNEYIIPKVQDEQGATWTVKVSSTNNSGGASTTDISDSPVFIGATFVQNT